MATGGKKGKKESFVRAKISFTSPYALKWSPLPQEDMHFILNTLKNKLVSTGFAKKEVKVFRPWRKKKVKDPAPTSEPAPEVKQDAPEVKQDTPEAKQDTPVEDAPKNGWTDVAARKQLAIGINEATKALERNNLKLLLVCKSVKPKHMTDHLIALSATRGVPACQVPRLSQSVAELMGLKSVLALGFRHCDSKDDEVFTDTVEAIMPRVPSLDVPWLQSVKPDDFVDTKEEEEEEKEKEEGVSEKRGQKRKLESDSDTTETAITCSLQPLQVKKIVGNPEKKEKKKQKGKGKAKS